MADTPRRWPHFIALAIVAVLVGDGAVLLTRDPDPGHPSEWDARVAPLIEFVESERSLTFKHPVAVEFMDADTYRREITTEEATLTEQDKREIEDFSGQARALGLIPSDLDLVSAMNQVTGEGTLAFYDSELERVVVQGTELTVGRRGTLVHELTHVLQDQHFDLDREFASDGAGSAFHALAEGDASRVESAYVNQLSDEEEEQYFAEEEGASEDADLGGVPPALLQLFGAPYALGEPFVELVIATRGRNGLDRAFRSPPGSDEALVDPFTFLDGQKPTAVAEPRLGRGEEKIDDGDFGSVAWLVVLSNHIDLKTALRAVDGWGGDAYLGYRRDGRSCLRIHFTGDEPSDNQEMAAALEEWRKPFPPERVQVQRNGNVVELDACDPGVVPAPGPGADQAIRLPVVRSQVALEVLREGAPQAVVQCISRRLVEEVPLDVLASDDPDPEEMFRIGMRLGQACVRETGRR